MSKQRNLDFVFLAALPFVAVLGILIIYVYGVVPAISAPDLTFPGSSYLMALRADTSQNMGVVVAVLGATAAGVVGCTWAAMVLLDLRKGMMVFVRWVLQRPPRHVSGILRPDYQQSWTSEKGVFTDRVALYRARRNAWAQEQANTSSTL
jgi:hypothetical protein